jgi:hypothetical protein
MLGRGEVVGSGGAGVAALADAASNITQNKTCRIRNLEEIALLSLRSSCINPFLVR